MKKIIIIIMLCILVSFFAGLTTSNEIFLTDSKNLVAVMLTVLGLCFSGFTYVLATINNIIKKYETNQNKKNIKNNGDKLLKNVEENIMLILYLTIFLVIVNLFYYINIPLIKNPHNIDFGICNIFSLKLFIYKFCSSLSFCLSIYSFYDIIKATFKILKSDN